MLSRRSTCAVQHQGWGLLRRLQRADTGAPARARPVTDRTVSKAGRTPSARAARAEQRSGVERGNAWRADASDLPFAELGIAGITEKVGGVRVRQHSNPLKRELQVPAKPLDWDAVYDDPAKPLVLDIGSGYGRFLLMMDRRMEPRSSHNFLGIELRNPIVDRSNKWAEELGQSGSVQFMHANGTVSIDSILSSYPGSLSLVTVQYPDPHFKKRHHKRRIVQPQLVEAIARNLAPGGRVLLQSDVEEVAAAMRNNFERHGGDAFELSTQHVEGECFSCSEPEEEEEGDQWQSKWAEQGWMAENPLGVPTEREVYTLQDGLPVYRAFLSRTSAPAPTSDAATMPASATGSA